MVQQENFNLRTLEAAGAHSPITDREITEIRTIADIRIFFINLPPFYLRIGIFRIAFCLFWSISSPPLFLPSIELFFLDYSFKLIDVEAIYSKIEQRISRPFEHVNRVLELAHLHF